MKPAIDRAFDDLVSPLLHGSGIGDIEEDASRTAPRRGQKNPRQPCLHGEPGPARTASAAIPMAVAVELIQAASLIHDDFVDQDRYRRNSPALWTLEGARRAVLLGDVLFSTAIKMMSDLGQAACRIVSEGILELSTGALYEPILPAALIGRIASDRYQAGIYETIIALKGGTLFSMACRLGAISAGADQSAQEAFRRYGSSLGEAYQIADDAQELARHIATRSIQQREMALLAPCLLYFSNALKPHIPSHHAGGINGSSKRSSP